MTRTKWFTYIFLSTITLSLVSIVNFRVIANANSIFVRIAKEKIRESPNGKHAGELVQGTKLNVIEQQGDWIKVQYEGWIWAKSTTTDYSLIDNEKNCPLQVIRTWVEKNSAGTPEAHVIVKNISDKEIDAYKVYLHCFNAFDEPVNYYLHGQNVFSGIAQDEILKPEEESCEYQYWSLFGYDTTKKITVEITEVHFVDGTTWKNINLANKEEQGFYVLE